MTQGHTHDATSALAYAPNPARPHVRPCLVAQRSPKDTDVFRFPLPRLIISTATTLALLPAFSAAAASPVKTPPSSRTTSVAPTKSRQSAATTVARSRVVDEARLFSPTERPASTALATAPIEVGLRFSPKVNGMVTAISIYRPSNTPGSRTGHLYDASGARLASVTVTGTSRGWQRADLRAPVRLTAGRTYYVSYEVPSGSYAITQGGLSRPRVTPSLVTTAGAGVVRSGSHGALEHRMTSDNYWVDVHVSDGTPTKGNAAGDTRDMYKRPFSSGSIWNMPIGSSAQYLPLGLTPPSQGYALVSNHLILEPDAPLRPLVDRGYWWPWTDGTSVKGDNTGISVRIPDHLVIAPPPASAYEDRPSAALQADGRVREFQYTVRPTASSPISMFEGPRAVMDLRGDGLTPDGQSGAHGGSGLTAVGGTLRAGELSGPEPIRHALAVTMNLTKWGTAEGGRIEAGYRWPAKWADYGYERTAFASGYGSLTRLGFTGRDGLGEGSLLALPATVDIAALKLETPAGAKLAWTYQNYGAYVVDNAGDTGSYDVFRHNIEEAAAPEARLIDTGYAQTGATPFGRDMNKIFTRLAVIDNNGPSSIGGGGRPRQPLAPDLPK